MSAVTADIACHADLKRPGCTPLTSAIVANVIWLAVTPVSVAPPLEHEPLPRLLAPPVVPPAAPPVVVPVAPVVPPVELPVVAPVVLPVALPVVEPPFFVSAPIPAARCAAVRRAPHAVASNETESRTDATTFARTLTRLLLVTRRRTLVDTLSSACKWPLALLRLSPFCSTRFRPSPACVGIRFAREPKDPLADDVAEHFRRSAADRQGGCKKEPIRPPHGIRAERSDVGEQPRRAGQVARDLEDVLPVRIAQRFAGRRFRSERLAGKAVGDHAQRVDAKDLAFGVQLREALAHDRVADAATLLNQVHEVARRGTPAPLRAFARERDTFVGQGVLRELPAAVLFADEVLSGETNVGEEDLVE